MLEAGEYGVADKLDGVGTYGVSDGVISVHPIGNPISASVKFGWIFHPCAPTSSCTRETVAFLYRPLRLCSGIPKPRPSMLAVGVGHNEHSASHVWRTHGAHWKDRPFRIEPDGGQASEYDAQPVVQQRCDVFHDDEAWSKFANQAEIFKPEAGTLTLEAKSRAGATDILTREPAADDINGNSICSQSVGGEGSDIFITRDIRPMLCEDFAGE